jgi:hypothetical protein
MIIIVRKGGRKQERARRIKEEETMRNTTVGIWRNTLAKRGKKIIRGGQGFA